MPPMTPASAPPPASTLAHMCLPHDHIFVRSTIEEGEDERCEEEDAVHDAEGEAGLEHTAMLLHVHGHACKGISLHRISKGPKVDAGAVIIAGVAELVGSGDEGADEAQVDEADEEGVVAGLVVCEERADGPDGGEDGDDEEG